MMKKYIQKFTGLSLLLLFISGPGFAAMYKWVDADGNVHYTQSPPPGDIEGETIKPPPKVDTDKALKELQDRQDKIKSINEDRTREAEEEKMKEGNLAKKKAACDLAKDKLAKASGSTRVYATDEKGNRVKLGEDERQARIDAAKKEVAEFCK